MSDSDSTPNESPSGSVEPEVPVELPPVQPPSPGFIIQLFVIPALIVLAVIAVWALFGQISASDQDWRGLVSDLRTTNEHRRGRSATALAQMIRADIELGEKGQHLAANPTIAKELADLLTEKLNDPTAHEKKDLVFQAFLARTLRLLDQPDIVLPALRAAIQEQQDRDVRKNAIASLAVIGGEYLERGKPIDDPELIDDLVDASRETDPLIRQLAAFSLGLFPSEASHAQLRLLLSDGFDLSTRANAAIGLARQGDSSGYDVFVETLEAAQEPPEPAETAADESAAFEEFLAVKNVLQAVGDLAEQFSDSQRAKLVELCAPISEAHPQPAVKVAAAKTLLALKSPTKN